MYAASMVYACMYVSVWNHGSLLPNTRCKARGKYSLLYRPSDQYLLYFIDSLLYRPSDQYLLYLQPALPSFGLALFTACSTVPRIKKGPRDSPVWNGFTVCY